MNKLLDGKVAIITGGSKGIGAATAELFVQEGASVVICARGEERLRETEAHLKEMGGKVLAIRADISSVEDCKKLFEATVKEFGKIDILVNNAGLSSMQTIDNISDEEWERITFTNYKGTFNCCREAIKYFAPKNEGVIVNVSSTTSLRPLGGIAYVASKHAVNGMTRSIGLQYAGTGIRCNCVCPGPTNTEMNADSMDGDLANDKFMDLIVKRIDLVNVPSCEPIDQAKAILFFASDLSAALNGVVFACDKGIAI